MKYQYCIYDQLRLLKVVSISFFCLSQAMYAPEVNLRHC